MRDGRGRIITIVVAFLLSFNSLAQEIELKGGFVEDSLLIGQDVNFWITATYPTDLELIFPDSTYNFSPFEYSAKTYFPTKLVNDLAFDSTVYSVQSFEIDLIQYLKLSAIILDGADSMQLETSVDSIYLTELAPYVTDTTQLIANTNYQIVDTLFNYPLLYIIVGGVLVLVLILLLIFGKKIIRFFKLRRLRKEYEHFSTALLDYIRQLKKEPKPEIAESALFAWKRYQEKLDKFPFTKLTTKEILDTVSNKELEKPLRSIDRLIYGKRETATVYQDFQQIEDFVQHRYNKKVGEIRDGK